MIFHIHNLKQRFCRSKERDFREFQENQQLFIKISDFSHSPFETTLSMKIHDFPYSPSATAILPLKRARFSGIPGQGIMNFQENQQLFITISDFSHSPFEITLSMKIHDFPYSQSDTAILQLKRVRFSGISGQTATHHQNQ